MSIRMTKSTEVTVGTFQNQLSNGLGVSQLESTLQNLDVSDSTAVAKEVRRCNRRCSGNDVDVDVSAIKTINGASSVSNISMSFKLGTI